MAKLSEQDKVVLDRVKEAYDWAKAERDQRTGPWLSARKQYDSEWQELEKKQDDEDLDQFIFVPKTFIWIQRLLGTALGHFFPASEQKMGRVVPTTGDADGAEDMVMLDKLLHAKVDVELAPRRTYHDGFLTTLVEGSGVLKGGWRKERWVDHRGVERRISVARLEHVPNEHVVFDPYALTPDQISFAIHEVWLTGEELWARQAAGVYRNVKDVTDGASDAGGDVWRQEIGGPGDQTCILYKVLEFWGPLQLKSAEQLERLHRQGKHTPKRDVLTTIHDSVVLQRPVDNPYAKMCVSPTPFEKLPFWIGVVLPGRNSIYGESVASRVKDIQREINTKRNQRIQAVEQEMMGGKCGYDENRVTDLKQLQAAQQGGFFGTQGDPGKAVKWWAPDIKTAPTVNEEIIITQDGEDSVGVSNIHQGRHEPGVDTATATSILHREGNVTQEKMLANLADSCVTPVLKFFANCIVKYVSPKEAQATLGTLTPLPPLQDLFTRDFQIQIEAGASAASRQARIRELQFANQSLGQVVNAAPEVVLPAMMLTTGELVRELRVPGAAKRLEEAVQQMGGGRAPAGDGAAGQLPYGATTAMAQQGRGPSPEERRRTPQPVGAGRR